MKTNTSLLLSIFLTLSISLNAQFNRYVLTSKYSKEEIGRMLLEQEKFLPVPGPEDAVWAKIDSETKRHFIDKAEEYLDYEWPSLLASRFMEFDINGNRSRYESTYFKRRNVLADLCMGELMENKGRFIPDIINGVWLILEETTWVIPAHSPGDKLQDKDNPEVDLFNAETAGLLAWVDYFIGPKLDQVTPLIRDRLYKEVHKRVNQSMLDHDYFWYMGFTGRIPNNWNPWIVSNWLTSVLLLEKDPEFRTESVWKALRVLDNYLNPHPSDGGCDEGPSYWDRAGASLFDCLFLLQSATGDKYMVYDNPLIKNIGNYIVKIHIDKDWYVNFADGSALNSHDPATLFRIGKAINDKAMMGMAADKFRHLQIDDRIPSGRSPFGLRVLPELLIMPELASYISAYEAEESYYLQDLEVAVARENTNNKGFYYAIKGGFNNESHNHNDVGSFVVFYDAKPLMIDAGVETYTAKTFSSERYSIWTMQSQYHNLPTLNGEMQKDGDEFKAKDFSFLNEKNKSISSVEISSAYPSDCYTDQFIRTLVLDRKKKELELTDTWSQERQLEKNQWHFMLAYKPELIKDGQVKLSNGDKTFLFKYSKHFSCHIEMIEIDDPRLLSVWDKSIYRMTLTTGKKGLKGSETFTIEAL